MSASIWHFKVLDDVRVHVLAGPRSARTLPEYGAEVLHISSPSYPDAFAQHLGVALVRFQRAAFSCWNVVGSYWNQRRVRA